MIPIRETRHGAIFAIRVQPRAKHTAITGVFGEGEEAALKLALASPPVDGRANEAIIEFFAELLNVPRSQVQILIGEKSRSKVIRVRGQSAARVCAAIEQRR